MPSGSKRHPSTLKWLGDVHLIALYVAYATVNRPRKADYSCMSRETVLEIQSADRVRDGVLLTFSDGVAVLYPTTFLVAMRDHEQLTRIPDDDY